jgi:hypothetical protein
MHINLIIATPGHSVMGPYLKSLLASLALLSEKNISWTYTNAYSSNVADAREITLSGTYRNNINDRKPLSGQVTYDKILWIDSDIAFSPEDVLRLYESDKDIISGAYMLPGGEVAAYKTLGKGGFNYQTVLALDEPVKIEGCGFGFVCVKQGVFESMSRPWFQQVRHTVELDGEKIDFPLMGEDLSWCKRALDLGYEIWFDPKVKVTHHKTVQLHWEGLK